MSLSYSKIGTRRQRGGREILLYLMGVKKRRRLDGEEPARLPGGSTS